MAVSSILIPPDQKRDAKARELVSRVKTWHVGTLNRPWGAFEAGTVYRITPSGWQCNAVYCRCPDYRGGHICKHIRAIVLWEQEQARLDTEIDAAIADALGESSFSWAELRASMPSCAAGCGNLIDGRGSFCDDCAAIREHAERLAAGRRRVIEEWTA